MSDSAKRKKSSAFTSILLGGFLLIRRLTMDYELWTTWDIVVAILGAGFVIYGLYQLFSAGKNNDDTPEEDWKQVD